MRETQTIENPANNCAQSEVCWKLLSLYTSAGKLLFLQHCKSCACDLGFAIYRSCFGTERFWPYTLDSVIARSISPKVLAIDTPYLAREGEVWVSFVSSKSDWCFAALLATLCVISWYSVPCHNAMHRTVLQDYVISTELPKSLQ